MKYLAVLADWSHLKELAKEIAIGIEIGRLGFEEAITIYYFFFSFLKLFPFSSFSPFSSFF